MDHLVDLDGRDRRARSVDRERRGEPLGGHLVEASDSDGCVTLHVNFRHLLEDSQYGDGRIVLRQRQLLEMQELLNRGYYEQMLDIVRKKDGQ